jgi:hypothetical protein
MLLQQGQGRLEVGGLAEAATRGGGVGVAAAKRGSASAVDPVQQPASLFEAGVGTHEVEGGPGVLDQVIGQPNGVGEAVGADGLGPAVAQVACQVQQGGEAAGGAGESGRPAGQMGQVAAAGGDAGLQVTLEGEQQLGRLTIEDQQSRTLSLGFS